jgi:hypothetical protein
MALLAALLLTAAPLAASPPERTLTAAFGEFYDPATNTLVLANITGEARCDWVLGGFSGDPDVIELTETTWVTTGSGATIFHFHATWQLEAYRFPVEPQSPEEECALMDQYGVWATGQAKTNSGDNDVTLSGGRTNSFGWRVNGSLTDAEGEDYRFHRVFRAQIRDGEFILLVDKISIR